MWPVVDTAFSSGSLTAGPMVNTGKPGQVTLLPVGWNVTWTIKRGLTGNGNNTGNRDHPLVTVQQALQNLAAAYTSNDWPEKGTELESPGAIVILDTVEAAQRITVEGSLGACGT
jgi:hypothetical protein